MITIEHTFLTKCHDLRTLFDQTNKLSTFMRKLEQQSLKDPLRYDSNKYLGDGFEFFVEILLKLHPVDNRVGIYNYSPKQTNDNGVDGVGINILGEPAVIQIKYRSNTQELLTSNKDHLGNLIVDGMMSHNVVIDNIKKDNYRHFVYTTAKSLHFYTDSEMFKGKVKCVGYNEIRGLVDNNVAFWNTLRSEVFKNYTGKWIA